MDATTQTSPPLMALTGAGVQRGNRWLVRNVDLRVNAGEIVTLIGPNGSGKSTTVKMAIGLMTPDEGQSTRKTGLTIGYVPQKLNIDGTLPLTVQRLLTLGARHSKEAVADALAAVDISRLADTQVQTLSGGEFQRALLARAMIGKPDVLVLDEPVQGVDFAGEIALYDLIREIRDTTGCGILLISHDLHMVMAATDTVICLNGHVCCTGSPDAVAADPEYVRLFGARAAETLAIYKHNHDHVHLPDGRVRHSDGTITDHCYPGDGHHHNAPADESGIQSDTAQHPTREPQPHA